LRLGEIARDVLPAGVLNVVSGDGTAGNALRLLCFGCARGSYAPQ